jgi:putative DNA primase/helicase
MDAVVPFDKSQSISLSLREKLYLIVQQIPSDIDLISTMQNTLRDNLVKYRSADGSLNIKKIPLKLFHVAILEELKAQSNASGWGFAQEHGQMYIYTGRQWEKVAADHMLKFLSAVSMKMNYVSIVEAMTHSFTDALLKQCTVSANIFERKSVDDGVMLINLQNGTLEINANGCNFREHRRDDYLTYCLGFDYDPSAKSPIFNQYLNRVLPDTGLQHILQEFHGYVFTRGLKLEKALILLGEGANGKSVQFEVSRAIFGEVNLSSKSLGDLVDRDSGNDNRAKLKDKLVNYGSEIRGDALDVDIFKRLVSGEPVAAREKYKTGFDLQNECKFIFNANRLPQTVERTNAFFRRFLIVPYNFTIPEEERDPELHTKIISTELSGILNWVIIGLERLLQNRKFTESQISNDALEQYKNETNIVKLFLDDEGYTPDDTSFMSTKILYSRYSEWCHLNGFKRATSVVFGKDIAALGFESYRTSRERGYRAKQVLDAA